MSAAMGKFLDHLIESSDDGVADIQIIFEPGVSAIAGAVRKVPEVDGIYEMLTYSAPADVPPQLAQQLPKEQLIATSMFFSPTAVQRIMKEKEKSNITLAQPGDLPVGNC